VLAPIPLAAPVRSSYDAEVDRLLADIELAIGAQDEPLAAAAAGVGAYLDGLAARPAFARTFLLEVLAAGPAALARRAAVLERFASYLEEVHAGLRAALSPGIAEPPAHRFRAAVGATDALVSEHLRVHGAEGLRELSAAVLDVQTGLLLGWELAERLGGGAGGAAGAGG
jgi:AcrR family transcriptional regulator